MNKLSSYPLLLLHGALGSRDEFDRLIPELENHFTLHLIEFEGHGQTGPTDSPFRVEYFSENILGYLDENGIDKVNIFGYSMGGYVALTLAKEYPKRVHKVATLGTILQWNSQKAEEECRYLHPRKIEEKVPHFASQLANRHVHGWKRVVDQTREMLQYLGKHPNIKEGDWKEFDHRIRFHIGDKDTTAGLYETVEVFHKMKKAELSVLPGSGHPIHENDEQTLLNSLTNFF